MTNRNTASLKQKALYLLSNYDILDRIILLLCIMSEYPSRESNASSSRQVPLSITRAIQKTKKLIPTLMLAALPILPGCSITITPNGTIVTPGLASVNIVNGTQKNTSNINKPITNPKEDARYIDLPIRLTFIDKHGTQLQPTQTLGIEIEPLLDEEKVKNSIKPFNSQETSSGGDIYSAIVDDNGTAKETVELKASPTGKWVMIIYNNGIPVDYVVITSDDITNNFKDGAYQAQLQLTRLTQE